MIDRYEEFKEWFRKQPSILRITKSVKCDGFETELETEDIFEAFEKEYEEESRRKYIKNMIADKIYCENYYKLTIGQQAKITRIYDTLKDGGYLK